MEFYIQRTTTTINVRQCLYWYTIQEENTWNWLDKSVLCVNHYRIFSTFLVNSNWQSMRMSCMVYMLHDDIVNKDDNNIKHDWEKYRNKNLKVNLSVGIHLIPSQIFLFYFNMLFIPKNWIKQHKNVVQQLKEMKKETRWKLLFYDDSAAWTTIIVFLK